MSTPTTAPRRARTVTPKLDAVAAAAVETAREALAEVTEPGQVGEHLRAVASGDRLVTHVFECTMPGYRGWSWVVVLSRAPRAKVATVAETALLPGEDSLLAPEWEPWAERLQPSDVGADDLMPFQEQDVRLEQGYEATGAAEDEEQDRVAQWELGLGRERVLSPLGRAEAAERWAEGDFGPRQVSTRKRRDTVAATCSSCGFLTRLDGSLRSEFGVCTNEWSPADGRVVHLGYGCGSHSQTGQDDEDKDARRAAGVVVDEFRVDLDREPAPNEEPAVAEPTAEESAGSAPAEPAAEPAEPAEPVETAEVVEPAASAPSEDAPAEAEAEAETEATAPEQEATDQASPEQPEQDVPEDEPTGSTPDPS